MKSSKTDSSSSNSDERTEGQDFIRTIVAEDRAANKYGGQVITRFPPEPNGYLHIGHAKSICLNFGIALENGGYCHMRFDDTNPTTEDIRYVENIQQDIRWLGFDWGEYLFFASDHFPKLYAYAVQLIKDGKAYVDSLNEEEIRTYRGTVTEAGRESPYRSRSVEENLALFEQMRAGKFEDGAHVLRAKIDMAAPNMKMRDPLLYRIRHAHHYRSGNEWCIYPMYDFAHPLSDAIEGITHSICTLEFENNREIYDWLLENTQEPPRPYQYEFARLNLDYTLMSKRKLLRLVNEGYVNGWDDPRMMTIAGLRRRGVRAEAIRNFSERVGVAKTNSRVDMALLDYCIRDDLNQEAPRVMCVLHPLRVVITNYPKGGAELLEAPYFPRDVPKEGSRVVPMSREIYIERDDFMEKPEKGFFRLSPGGEVRLRYGYIIKCEEVIKDEATGEITELRCTYDLATKSGASGGRRVKGTIHWLSVEHSLPVEVRLYDRLFIAENPDDTEEGKSFLDYLNPNSVEILHHSRVEPSVADAAPGDRFQFERQGYFVNDTIDSSPEKLVYNRIVTLRDSWVKTQEKDEVKVETKEKGAGKGRTKRSRTEIRAEIRSNTPELAARFVRYQEALGLGQDEADILTGDLGLAQFFETALAAHNNPASVARWVNNELLGELKGGDVADLPFSGAQLGALVALLDDETISGPIAKQLFAEMMKSGKDPQTIIEEKGLKQISDPDALGAMIDGLIAANEAKAAQYRAGKTGLMGFFVGQVMRETRGTAEPQLVQKLVKEKLG